MRSHLSYKVYNNHNQIDVVDIILIGFSLWLKKPNVEKLKDKYTKSLLPNVDDYPLSLITQKKRRIHNPSYIVTHNFI